jgi:hypothetical protein
VLEPGADKEKDIGDATTPFIGLDPDETATMMVSELQVALDPP